VQTPIGNELLRIGLCRTRSHRVDDGLNLKTVLNETNAHALALGSEVVNAGQLLIHRGTRPEESAQQINHARVMPKSPLGNSRRIQILNEIRTYTPIQ
jgi:hypothetical protein